MSESALSSALNVAVTGVAAVAVNVATPFASVVATLADGRTRELVVCSVTRVPGTGPPERFSSVTVTVALLVPSSGTLRVSTVIVEPVASAGPPTAATNVTSAVGCFTSVTASVRS